MKNSLFVVTMFVMIGFLSIGGCTTNTEEFPGCDFDFNGILNGPNFDEATSEWNCGGEFAFYQDETGRDFSVLTDIDRTGCRTVSFEDQAPPAAANTRGVEMIQGVYDNLAGSVDEGVLSFDRIVDEESTFLECVINIFGED